MLLRAGRVEAWPRRLSSCTARMAHALPLHPRACLCSPMRRPGADPPGGGPRARRQAREDHHHQRQGAPVPGGHRAHGAGGRGVCGAGQEGQGARGRAQSAGDVLLQHEDHHRRQARRQGRRLREGEGAPPSPKRHMCTSSASARVCRKVSAFLQVWVWVLRARGNLQGRYVPDHCCGPSI